MKMLKIWSPFKNISRPVLVFFFIFSFVVIIYVFWLLNRAPSAESVFWQAIDNNLNSRSVVLETEFSLVGAQQNDLVLLDNQLSLSFAPEVYSHLQQKILSYDQSVAEYYVNPLQLDHYQSVGIQDLPQQAWREQSSFSFNNRIYINHDLYSQPAREDWRDAFNTEFTELPFGEQWYEKDIQAVKPADFQHSLMTAVANEGFLYGKLGMAERQQIMTELKKAYQPDFTNVDAFWRDGRFFYEYEVAIDQREFALAFIKYSTANAVNLNQTSTITEEDVLNALAGFSRQDVTYSVLVDVWSHQIVQIEYPFQTGVIFYYPILSEEFTVLPYFSPMIRDLYSNTDLIIKVTTKISGLNQDLDLQPPEEAVRLIHYEMESEELQ